MEKKKKKSKSATKLSYIFPVILKDFLRPLIDHTYDKHKDIQGRSQNLCHFLISAWGTDWGLQIFLIIKLWFVRCICSLHLLQFERENKHTKKTLHGMQSSWMHLFFVCFCMCGWQKPKDPNFSPYLLTYQHQNVRHQPSQNDVHVHHWWTGNFKDFKKKKKKKKKKKTLIDMQAFTWWRCNQ